MTRSKPDHPDPKAFMILSKGFKDAGDMVTEKIHLGHREMTQGDYTGFAVIPAVFLYFRSIELALKSVLGHHQIPAKEVAGRIGHNLGLLLDECTKVGALNSLRISPETESMLRAYSATYCKKWFEYSDDFWCTPDISDLRDTCSAIHAAAKSYGSKYFQH